MGAHLAMWGLVLVISAQPPAPPPSGSALARAKERAYRSSQAALRVPPRMKTAEEVDVGRYDIDLEVLPDTREIRGGVRLVARVLTPTASLILDMNSSWLAVDSIAGPAVSWDHQSHLLTIQLDRQYTASEILDLTVVYHGSPLYSSFGIPFFDDRDGVPLIATLSEPFGARNWWPCKDQPDDKADTVSISVTVPSSLTVASNGRLLGTDPLPNGRSRYRWLEEYPIASYLVSLAITDYVTVTEWYVPGRDSIPVVHYLYPELAGSADAFAVTVPAMGELSSRFGPYPFPREKYGHALFPWGGAMEHQTCTSMGEWAAYGGWEWIIVHELAHQWWGDLVTCASFHHIWLNEGFATYGEAVWQEVEGGMDAYHAAVAGDAYYGGGTIYVEDPATEEIFNYGLSYQKGSYVLHMLRHVVGDSTFFQGLLAYRDRCAYASATTDDFKEAMEEISGRDLDWFFEQWIYQPYYPQYEYGWICHQEGAGWRTRLRVDQVQSNTGLFTMPLDVRLSFQDGAEETGGIWANGQTVTEDFPTAARVTAVALDPNHWVLSSITEVPLEALGLPNPAVVRLDGPWPQPARDTAMLLTWSPDAGRLTVCDILGRQRLIRRLPEGRHLVSLRVEDLMPPGVYVVRLSCASGSDSRLLVVR